MQILAGILLLVIGTIFPLALLMWLSQRMNRQPALSAQQVGLVLAFNGVLPVGLIMLGLGLLSPRVWASFVVRTVTIAALVAAAVLLVLLAVTRSKARRKGEGNG